MIYSVEHVMHNYPNSKATTVRRDLEGLELCHPTVQMGDRILRTVLFIRAIEYVEKIFKILLVTWYSFYRKVGKYRTVLIFICYIAGRNNFNHFRINCSILDH